MTSSYGTSAVEPQKSQRLPICWASKTEMAWQLWQRTEIVAVCQPRAASGIAAERDGQIVLDDRRVARRGFQLRRRLGSAERADERLFAPGSSWLPLRTPGS